MMITTRRFVIKLNRCFAILTDEPLQSRLLTACYSLIRTTAPDIGVYHVLNGVKVRLLFIIGYPCSRVVNVNAS